MFPVFDGLRLHQMSHLVHDNKEHKVFVLIVAVHKILMKIHIDSVVSAYGRKGLQIGADHHTHLRELAERCKHLPFCGPCGKIRTNPHQL